MNILISGAAGYVGGMLADQYRQHDEVGQIICIDKEPCPEWLEGAENLVWIQANLHEDEWEGLVDPYEVQVVVHAAWQIRDWYGARAKVRELNIESSRRVFTYAFEKSSVRRLIYFSSIAQYGALPSNTRHERFTEESPTRLTGYCYADDKHEVDELLGEMYRTLGASTAVRVIKPATITGPRGRLGVGTFSLATALSSYANKSAIPRVVQWTLVWMPVIGRWTRQFVHEDDISEVVALWIFTKNIIGMDTYIVSPHDIIDGTTMAQIVEKRTLPVPVWLARLVFALMWHTTRGRIPTAPGAWRFMAYSICVDGSKVHHQLGYNYRYTSVQAISELSGRYAPHKTDD